MLAKIDSLLDRITMYRLVLYILLSLLGLALVLAFVQRLPFTPLALAGSTLFLIFVCWGVNNILALIFEVPTNVESVYITALILALIVDPAKSASDLPSLCWIAILAISSKYILTINKKHIFNPAAIAVVVTSFALGVSASWWIGTATMLPAVLIAGLLLGRKLRQLDMLLIFTATVLAGITLFSFLENQNLLFALTQVLAQSPLFFFASIMLTEPLTAPTTRDWRRLYALLTGLLFLPQIHVGPLYSTPELALVVGNLFAYIVSPKYRITLKLKKSIHMTPEIRDFVFIPSQKINYQPGQYMEFTLAHRGVDSRGNRRYFTLASSPTERDIHLGVRFYELGSSFKRAMLGMNGQTRFIGSQLAGDFTLPGDPRQKLVFLAGGIGITPFRSMLKYLIDTNQRRDIVLFYMNRTLSEISYQDVLRQAEKKVGARIYYTLTDRSAIPANWAGLVGRIDPSLLARAVPDYRERIYYLSGPPEMVKAYERVLKELHISSSQIKKDFFPGLV